MEQLNKKPTIKPVVMGAILLSIGLTIIRYALKPLFLWFALLLLAAGGHFFFNALDGWVSKANRQLIIGCLLLAIGGYIIYFSTETSIIYTDVLIIGVGIYHTVDGISNIIRSR